MKPRTQKRLENEARIAERAKRTPEQQLARLDRMGWHAERERERLRTEIKEGRKAA